MFSISAAKLKAGLFFCSSVLLASCAQSPSSSDAATQYHTQVRFLAASHSMQLQQAEIGQSVQLATSPWGNSAELLVTARYFSAAGRECAAALVQTLQPALPVVLCQYDDGRWGITRSLTQLI